MSLPNDIQYRRPDEWPRVDSHRADIADRPVVAAALLTAKADLPSRAAEATRSVDEPYQASPTGPRSVVVLFANIPSAS